MQDLPHYVWKANKMLMVWPRDTLEYPQHMLQFLVLSFCLISYSLAILVPDNSLHPLPGTIVTIPIARNYRDSSGQKLSAYLPRFSPWTHLDTISVPTTAPRLAECHPARGRQKHRLYFQMLPLLPRWQMKQARLACQTWHNSTLSSSKILAVLKPVACCPSPPAEPGFWHCSGDGEAQDRFIEWGGHWAKEAEVPSCTWVRRDSEGSQEATGLRSLVSLDVVYKDGWYPQHYWNYLLNRVGKTARSPFYFFLLSPAIYSYA